MWLMILAALDMMVPTHQSTGLWRHPRAQPEQYRDLRFWTAHAQMLERAGFDALFLADAAGVYDVFDGSGRTAIRSGMQYPALDPLTAVSALAAATTTLGFGVTASVSYEQPYLLARRFASLDHLTDGRIGWNIVTGYQESAMRNLGAGGQLPHDARYDRADEFMDVVCALWEGTFEPGALRADAESGIYLDPDLVHGAGHEGEHFSVPGPALVAPGPQRTPYLFQAGSSPRGMAFAARHAEAMFFSGTSTASVRRLTDAARAGLEREGRGADAAHMLMSITVIADSTDAEAAERAASYAQFADRQAALALFAGWTGLDLAPFDPQTPLAQAVAQLTGDGSIEGNRSALQSFLELDPDRDWTVGEVAAHMCLGARGPVVIGSGATVAEELERWMAEAGVDGFNIDYGLRDVDMTAFAEHVSPELRRRGHLPGGARPGSTLRGRLTGADHLPSTHPGAAFRR